MNNYDVFIVGGGIAGSITAKYAAKSGLKTIMIEKEKVPRNKPCSGIQFGYFEKILGEKIPRERLCNNQLTHVQMFFPNGKSLKSGFKILNFMRKPFDEWLNMVAQENGAEFLDQCKFMDYEEVEDGIIVSYQIKDKNPVKVKADYLLDASGLLPVVRRKLRPQDFDSKSLGSTINYYVDGTSNLDPNTLYQFWNLDWNDAMFAWAYTKTLDDGKDYWVVGTGCNTGKVMDRQKLFYDYICDTFKLNGEIIKKEGYSTTINIKSKDRVWLGKDRIFMVGDAAGLVDQYRGVGMDAAALSGRLAAKAIIKAKKSNKNAFQEYSRLMKRITTQTKSNQDRSIGKCKNNEELQSHLDKTMLSTGIGMIFHSFTNKFVPPEMQTLLPP